uniref:Uncharacterized protein n=1 Tax=Romanomermis culicivorax TaxID=13658 RepID=A0A915IGV2_ROMCU
MAGKSRFKPRGKIGAKSRGEMRGKLGLNGGLNKRWASPRNGCALWWAKIERKYCFKNKLMDLLEYIQLLDKVVDEDWEKEEFKLGHGLGKND